MAAGAVQYQMITELAAVYGVEITTAHVKMIGTQMIQMLLKTGLVEATTSADRRPVQVEHGRLRGGRGGAGGLDGLSRPRLRATPSPTTSATASRGATAGWGRP